MTVVSRAISGLRVRPASPKDAPVLFELVCALAAYERLEHQVNGSAAALAEHLTASAEARPLVEALLAEIDGKAVGFALFFTNYSTFLTKPGIYLEDLFVLPEYRQQGIGKTLLTHLAKLAQSRDCGRLEWSVLDWNESAIAFYQKLGATVLPDWRICRVTGAAIHRMAMPGTGND